jgi:hypothetical protein
VTIDDTPEKRPQTGNHAAAAVIGVEGVTQRTPELIFMIGLAGLVANKLLSTM